MGLDSDEPERNLCAALGAHGAQAPLCLNVV